MKKVFFAFFLLSIANVSAAETLEGSIFKLSNSVMALAHALATLSQPQGSAPTPPQQSGAYFDPYGRETRDLGAIAWVTGSNIPWYVAGNPFGHIMANSQGHYVMGGRSNAQPGWQDMPLIQGVANIGQKPTLAFKATTFNQLEALKALPGQYRTFNGIAMVKGADGLWYLIGNNPTPFVFNVAPFNAALAPQGQ